MATVKICDRCRKIYKPTNKSCKVTMDRYRSSALFALTPRREYDLCPECSVAVVEFLDVYAVDPSKPQEKETTP